jgi:hypothetical protein
MPAQRIDHLPGNYKNRPTDRSDFEDLLRRAAALLNTSAKSPEQSPPKTFACEHNGVSG